MKRLTLRGYALVGLLTFAVWTGLVMLTGMPLWSAAALVAQWVLGVVLLVAVVFVLYAVASRLGL